MNIQTPLVSIIMGIYNCEDTLRESIDSIIYQSYTNWELIMCDDCSSDSTFLIAKSYVEKYPERIILYKNTKNLTLGPTLNKCIQYAKGELIARQDGDDISHKDRLKQQVEFLENNDQYDLVGTEMVIFNKLGIQGIRKVKAYPSSKDLMYGSVFAHATIVIRKKVMTDLGGYSQEQNRRQVEDYDLWFRFMGQGYKGCNLNQALYYVREDINSYKRKSFKRRLNELKVMKDGRNYLKLPFRYTLFLIKPILTLIIPKTLLRFYHEFRVKVKKDSVDKVEMIQ